MITDKCNEKLFSSIWNSFLLPLIILFTEYIFKRKTVLHKTLIYQTAKVNFLADFEISTIRLWKSNIIASPLNLTYSRKNYVGTLNYLIATAGK